MATRRSKRKNRVEEDDLQRSASESSSLASYPPGSLPVEPSPPAEEPPKPPEKRLRDLLTDVMAEVRAARAELAEVRERLRKVEKNNLEIVVPYLEEERRKKIAAKTSVQKTPPTVHYPGFAPAAVFNSATVSAATSAVTVARPLPSSIARQEATQIAKEASQWSAKEIEEFFSL